MSIRVKKLRSTNVVASRQFEKKSTSHPVDVHSLKTSLLNVPFSAIM